MPKPREYEFTLPDGSKRYEIVDPEFGIPILKQIAMFKKCTERCQPVRSQTSPLTAGFFFQQPAS